jgi:predicted branched-subunit amino acid permease
LRPFLPGLAAGARDVTVLLPTVALYGVAFGVMAGTVGLTLGEAAFFSAWVYAGGAQMASLQGWDHPVPLLFVSLTTLAINARYVLMGATLRPRLPRRSPLATYAALFFMGDANWAMTMRLERERCDGVAYLLGSGLAMWVVWLAGTMAGHGFGQVLGDPRVFGVDFMLAAFFAVTAVAFWEETRMARPLVVAVAVAIVAERLLPGPWYILWGALAGSLAGTWGPRVRAR